MLAFLTHEDGVGGRGGCRIGTQGMGGGGGGAKRLRDDSVQNVLFGVFWIRNRNRKLDEIGIGKIKRFPSSSDSAYVYLILISTTS